MAKKRRVPEPDSTEGSEEQAPLGMPAETESSDLENSRPSGACLRGDRADGWQDGPHHRSDPRQLRDDDDGHLLQHEAAGFFPQNGDRSVLAPGNRPETEKIGHQGEIREKSG